MIKPLRKYHFVIWHILAVLLPLFFIAAIVFRPFAPSGKAIGGNEISARIESNTDSTSLVILKFGKFIRTPSCVVILSSPSTEWVLGTLDRKGIYTFLTPKFEPPATLKLWDAIHHTSIDSVALTQNH